MGSLIIFFTWLHQVFISCPSSVTEPVELQGDNEKQLTICHYFSYCSLSLELRICKSSSFPCATYTHVCNIELLQSSYSFISPCCYTDLELDCYGSPCSLVTWLCSANYVGFLLSYWLLKCKLADRDSLFFHAVLCLSIFLHWKRFFPIPQKSNILNHFQGCS